MPRSPVIGSGIGTNFALVALPHSRATSPASGLTENRLSVQNSRLGIRIDSTVAGGQAIGYLETDFLGNARPALEHVRATLTPFASRVFFLDYTRGKLEFLAGQDWSMLTPNRVGINPIPGNIFFSQDMDTNYQVGLVWERITAVPIHLSCQQGGGVWHRQSRTPSSTSAGTATSRPANDTGAPGGTNAFATESVR